MDQVEGKVFLEKKPTTFVYIAETVSTDRLSSQGKINDSAHLHENN